MLNMSGRELRPVFDEYDDARILYDADLIRAGEALMSAGRLVVSKEFYNQAHGIMQADFAERYINGDPEELYGIPETARPALDANFQRIFPRVGIKQGEGRHGEGKYAVADLAKHRMVLELRLNGTMPPELDNKDLVVVTDGSLAGVRDYGRKVEKLNRNIGVPQPRLHELSKAAAEQYPRTGSEAYVAFSRLAKGARPLTDQEAAAYVAMMSVAPPVSRVSLGRTYRSPLGWYGEP